MKMKIVRFILIIAIAFVACDENEEAIVLKPEVTKVAYKLSTSPNNQGKYIHEFTASAIINGKHPINGFVAFIIKDYGRVRSQTLNLIYDDRANRSYNFYKASLETLSPLDQSAIQGAEFIMN